MTAALCVLAFLWGNTKLHGAGGAVHKNCGKWRREETGQGQQRNETWQDGKEKRTTAVRQTANANVLVYQ